ncbi:MAG: tetratricopeptide repeat protein [Phycisphaerae bacterium]|nr:tetratricopeptide repeat protein [Phycisphaerae bacterium]
MRIGRVILGLGVAGVALAAVVLLMRLSTGRLPWQSASRELIPAATPQPTPTPTVAPTPVYRRPRGAPSLGDDLVREFDQAISQLIGNAELGVLRLARQVDSSPQYYRVLAAMAIEADRPTKAEAFLRQAYRLQPNSVATLGQLGVVELRRKNPAAAQAWFEKALAVSPHDVDTLYNLAIAHQQQTHMHAAEDCYAKVLATQPDHFPAQFNLAGIATYFGRGEPEWEKAVRMRPDNLEARYQLGLSRYQLGRHDAAIAQFEVVRKKRPEDPDVWYHLALAHQGKGDDDKAFERYTEAVRLAPNDTLFLNGLADFHLTMHQRNVKETVHIDKAIRLWERSQAIDPKQEFVRDRLSIFRPK